MAEKKADVRDLQKVLKWVEQMVELLVVKGEI